MSRKEIKRLYARLEAGEESETPGLLEQWLREGKISEEQAISEAISTFGAGVDTVGLVANRPNLVVFVSTRLRTRVPSCSI